MRASREEKNAKIRIARKIIIFLYHNLMFHPRFPPRFESSSNIHPRFFTLPWFSSFSGVFHAHLRGLWEHHERLGMQNVCLTKARGWVLKYNLSVAGRSKCRRKSSTTLAELDSRVSWTNRVLSRIANSFMRVTKPFELRHLQGFSKVSEQKRRRWNCQDCRGHVKKRSEYG